VRADTTPPYRKDGAPSSVRRVVKQRPWIAGTSATLLVSLLCTLPVALPAAPYLGTPWGAGDMTYFYFMSSTWRLVAHAPTPLVAAPFGMDPNAFAGLDGLIYASAHLISSLAGNPFLGLNFLLLASFPLVALLAYCCVYLTGLKGPLAVALATAFTFIPFHFGRGIGHLPLALMLGLTTGVLLALLVGSNRLNWWLANSTGWDRTLKMVAVGLLIITTAWTGLYFAFYGVLLLGAALLWRFCAGSRARDLIPGVIALGSLTVTIVLGLVSILIGRANAPDSANVALRDPMDSVAYAGNLAIAVIPQPYSVVNPTYNDFVNAMFAGAPQSEPHLMANFGSWVTTAALLTFLVGLVVRSRRLALSTTVTRFPGTVDQGPPRVSMGYVSYLCTVVLLMFIPWGLNYIFSYLVTAQIRAWNRLLPYLLLLFIIGASAALAEWKWPRLRLPSICAAVGVILIATVEMVLPWRNLYATLPPAGQSKLGEVTSYVRQVRQAVPKGCALLTLPYIPYPGAGPVVNMDDYDHFTLALVNPDNPISYGAFRGSFAGQTLERLSLAPISQSSWELRQLGFCGVHVDARGYVDPQPILAELQSQLGPPIAAEGPYSLFGLNKP